LSSYELLGRDGRIRTSTRKGKLGGHLGTKIYGRLDCQAARRAIAKGGYVKNRVFFASEPDAIAAGFRPCAVCLPQAYARWKARKLRQRRAG
jgi:methylphosphotriester-DNA--protein-cysteine methyltransferase